MNPVTRASLAALVALLLVFSAGNARAQSFTLDQAIDYAQQHNKLVQSKAEEIDAAAGRVTDAWSHVMPQLFAQGGYTYMSKVPEINFTGPTIPDIPGIPDIPPVVVEKKMGDHDNLKGELKVMQLLFASGQAYKGIRMAAAGKRAAALSVESERDDLAYNVARSFYAVLFTRALHTAKAESLATAEAHLADVRNRFEFGTASRFELLRSEVEAANLRPEVDQAKNAVELARMGLKTQMGYKLGESIEVIGSLDDLALDLDYQQAMDEALAGRSALAGLDAAIEARDHGTWVATAGMLPKVSGFGTWGYQKPWYFEQDWTELWTVGVGVSIPLFDGLSALGKRREAAAQSRRLQKQRIALVDGIDFSIRHALLDLAEIRGRIEQTRDNVQRAEQACRMAQAAYKNGAATNLEILDAQLAQTGAKTLHIQALYDFQIAKTQLLAAAGRLR